MIDEKIRQDIDELLDSFTNCDDCFTFGKSVSMRKFVELVKPIVALRPDKPFVESCPEDFLVQAIMILFGSMSINLKEH